MPLDLSHTGSTLALRSVKLHQHLSGISFGTVASPEERPFTPISLKFCGRNFLISFSNFASFNRDTLT
ncbi:hypothetical protein L596_013429 [Steinernema carpocapsae]|uniref:Uncharacterized protein n=1 Tax=Steinernema carpocapsae TaxID=34508 RepID=A0A4U5P101_STECR|nr:hypothetical protein L596_013429 [Steinernema carpocapsae]